jgi:preprotein translocase subunit SecF
MSLFAIWQQAFGISYLDSFAATVALGVLLGVYSVAFDVDPFGWLKEKTPSR